ncbi:MAG: DUF420 domain-containing protein [Aquificae bacterium]|nr:DUF420 domain-containing protein [Aquificota bacterium]
MREILTLLGALSIGLSGILVILGLVFIKLKKKELHKRAMLGASFFALVFVVLYLIKSSLYPPRQYTGEHRTLYLFVLWSHTVLSVVNFPLVAYTLYLALRGNYDKHKKIARITAFVWLYVALTGWMIYFFLH